MSRLKRLFMVFLVVGFFVSIQQLFMYYELRVPNIRMIGWFLGVSALLTGIFLCLLDELFFIIDVNFSEKYRSFIYKVTKINIGNCTDNARQQSKLNSKISFVLFLIVFLAISTTVYFLVSFQ